MTTVWRINLPCVLLLLMSLIYPCSWADITIAVIGKTKNDSFYKQSFSGCQAYSETNPRVKCIYDGPVDYQDIRSQADIVSSVLETGVDGILISTTDSTYLVENALNKVNKRGIPVVTFDSDLLPEHHRYRMAYVGTNNFDYGQALGKFALKYKKEKITPICIQSGHETTPNLNDRIRGVRFALSGNKKNTRLQGEKGWVEHNRCPFFTMGQRSVALGQLVFLLEQESPPIYLAVAGFAQFSPNYIETVLPYRDRIKSNKIIVISADTEQIQLDALKQHLSTINIGQRPFEMGRLGAQLLANYIINNKRPEKEFYYLDYHYCMPENADSCMVR